MKKICLVALAAMMLVSMTACSSLTEKVKSAVAETVSGPKMTDEELYSELSSLMRSPSNVDSTSLTSEITFTAMVYTEPDEMEVEDEQYTYQLGYIARNIDDIMLLNVGALAEPIPVNQVVSITGTIDGSIYWVEENEKVDILDVRVSKVEVLPESEVVTDTSNKVDVETRYTSGTFEFINAHAAEDSMNDVIILYFDYTNNGTSESAPSFDKLFFFQGDELLNTSIFSVSEVAASALPTSGITEKTLPGKTFRYYCVLTANPEALGEPLYISLYDDQFNTTNDIEIPVAASLAEMEVE